MPILLASASPRRRDLLAAAGISFEVDPTVIDETREPAEAAEAYVKRIAREKATAAARRHSTRVVLAADTIVVVGERVLGKPIDAADAAGMLRALSGRAHVVMTAVAVARGGVVRVAVDRTTVRMRRIAEDEIGAYVSTGEPFDKAGAYAIQGGAGAFIDEIDGALDTVIGLPVDRVRSLLEEMGVKA
ncbi:MAG TPA: Maf family protein [Vicinamibacterales bacterium]